MDIDSTVSRLRLRRRIEVLSRGMLPPMFRGKPLRGFAGSGVGAGPQGRTFHVVDSAGAPSGEMISVPVYPASHHLSKYGLASEFDGASGDVLLANGMRLRPAGIPAFLTDRLADGSMLMDRGIAMVHSYGTMTSVFAYECRYFATGHECRYCELEPVGRGSRAFPPRQKVQEFVDAIVAAASRGACRSVTITSGTYADPDTVVADHIPVLREISERAGIEVHFQHEPVQDVELYSQTREYARTVGVFLEVYDEGIRREVCPGKSQTSLDEYIRNWTSAVKAYGRGNVMSTCILGFGEQPECVLKRVEQLADIGVMTMLLLLRPRSQHLSSFTPSYLSVPLDELVELYVGVARAHKAHGIAMSRLRAGCLGCQGCSAGFESEALA